MTQSSVDKARINLYASLVKREAKTLEEIPVEDRKLVEEVLDGNNLELNVEDEHAVITDEEKKIMAELKAAEEYVPPEPTEEESEEEITVEEPVEEEV